MKRFPHLLGAAIALISSLLAVLAYTTYAGYTETKYVHAVAALDHAEISGGSALERTALLQPDLLVIYGASELVLLDTKYEATRFFSTYPTGFMVFNAATKGGSALTIAQRFAGLGTELRGRRLIFAVGPAIMTMAPFGDVAQRHYDGNFSELHALELAYSPYISEATKRQAAVRMLEFSETLKDRPLVRFALKRLAAVSLGDRVLYYLSWPLGRLQIAIMHVQDHYATVEYIHHLSAAEVTVKRQPQRIDWTALIARAEKEQIANTDTNPYGVDNSQWPKIKELFMQPVPLGSRDADFINDVTIAREWSDMQIAMSVLQELGARAIILSSPMNVPLWEDIGVSEGAQDTYYSLLHSYVEPFHFPVIDSKEYGTIKYFSMDLASHASRKGWVYVDRTLDQIYHGILP
jgi:D-alanyl-lipoteichoic acid biosynthesis protein DltD